MGSCDGRGGIYPKSELAAKNNKEEDRSLITFSKEEKQTLISLYDAEIRYIDNALGYFINEINEKDLFNATYYNRGGYYLLNFNNNSNIKPYGVLDIIVKGKDTNEEAFIFLSCDYGKSSQNYITCSDKGVKLVAFLYFPYNLIEKTTSCVNYNVTTKIRVIDHFEDRDEERLIIMHSLSSINLSKIVEIEICSLKGNVNAESTAISIEEIKIVMNAENLKAYFSIVPKDETWLGYFPKGYYDSPNHSWNYRFSNLIEKTSSLEILEK